jgi:hypothetical protein
MNITLDRAESQSFHHPYYTHPRQHVTLLADSLNSCNPSFPSSPSPPFYLPNAVVEPIHCQHTKDTSLHLGESDKEK